MSFSGTKKSGPFNIPDALALQWCTCLAPTRQTGAAEPSQSR
jgi:hypothetical protein